MDTKVTHTLAPDAATGEDPLLAVMLAKARTMPTEELRAQYEEGLRLGSRVTLYAPTMTVLELMLAVRAAEVASSEVNS